MRRTKPAFRLGFTIIEILAAVAIIAIIAAIFVSSDTPESANDRARYDAAADALYNLSQAAAGSEPSKAARSFRQVVGMYPGALSHLTTPITQAMKNLCNLSYGATNVSNWTNSKNPFYGSMLLAAGTPIAPGFTVQDALTLKTTPPSSGSWANTMIITLPSVTQLGAQGLDLAVDGVVNNADGIVRYTTSDPTAVTYYTTISVIGGIVPVC